MWVFFRDDELGIAPKAFARLLALFDRYNQRLNAATSPELLAVALQSLPEGQASEYLQVVGIAGPGGNSSSPAQLQNAFTNFFPCYVGENPPRGYLMTSAPKAGGLPNFHTFLDLDSGLSAKEVFQALRRREEAGEDFAGLRIRHSLMTEEGFAILEELLHNLYKRSIPTSFFSDFIPGFERYSDEDSGHV